MKLTVLVDNNTYIDQYYYGEPAVCFYIEESDKKILFDTGYSDIVIKNAALMNIPLENLSTIVISHGHNDHTRGLSFLCEQMDTQKIELIAHPEAFEKKWFEEESIGSSLSEKQLQEKFQLTLSKEPLKILNNLWFLGEIPTVFEFEERKAIGLQGDKKKKPDFVKDDSALAYKSLDGLVIVTGCSHSGICNIIEYAKKVCEETRIAAVIGGFHLFEANEQLDKTIQYWQDNKISQVYPCHCVSFAAKARIHESIPIQEVGVSMQIEWI